MSKVEEIITRLNLQPHPEGGFYAETYKAAESVDKTALPERYNGPRSFGTAIYYLLTPDTFSMMHRVKSDEIFHFYSGDPVEMLLLRPDGSGETIVLGVDIPNGMLPQAVVPAGVWQGCRVIPGGEYALMGTTVSPGFEFDDYEEAERIPLSAEYPRFTDLIATLTH